MDKDTELNPNFKLWLEKEKEPIGGEGRIKLLETIDEEGSLNKAAEKMKMSYRHVWGIINKLEKKLDSKIVKSSKGGKGGGGTVLTENGRKIVEKYNWINKIMNEALREKTLPKNESQKISTHKNLIGKIENIEIEEMGTKLKIKLKPQNITVLSTKGALKDLDLNSEDEKEIVIKATEVIIKDS